ncbi:TraR/DksA C4-type zinc finger protein [Microbacterium sp. NPDC077184]|uniref:TraR/DksA family transcriptional regulator n=1 Tax=Microbacterium sp. NPDC077184 TaxID=3154764 RepID=UPI0034334A56
MPTPHGPTVHLERARAAARARLSDLDAQIAALRRARSGESDDDEHDPDGAPLSGEWSRLEGLRAEVDRELAEIDAAFDRVADGTYGICRDCGRAIPVGRLEVRPTADRCVTCASARGR